MLIRVASRSGTLAAAMQHLRTKNVRINDRSLIAQFGSPPVAATLYRSAALLRV